MRGLKLGVAGGLVSVFSAGASAGIFEDLYRGFEILATPTGSPVSSAGGGFLQNGARLGRVRIVPNELGSGYRLEFDRSFGNDISGRPEVFDTGNGELELSGAIDLTAEVTTRGIPTFELTSNTNNLNYSLRGKTGAQDVELRGTLNAATLFEINPLGFYTLSVNADNTNADVLLDGVLVEGQEDADFTLGPINVQGNLWVDLFTAAAASFGADTSEIEGAFADSPIDLITDEIADALSARLRVVEAGIAAGEYAVAADDETDRTAPIPEPAALTLLLVGGALAARRR